MEPPAEVPGFVQHAFYSSSNAANRRVAILVDKEVQCEILKLYRDSSARWIWMGMRILSHVYNFVSFYGP